MEALDAAVLPRLTGAIVAVSLWFQIRLAVVVRFALPQGARVKIGVYDLVDRQVATLIDADYAAGVHTARWNSRDAAPGVYFVRMVAGDRSLGQRMVLLR